MQTIETTATPWRSPMDGRVVATVEGGVVTLEFGKHRGWRLEELPAHYLGWIGSGGQGMAPVDLQRAAVGVLLHRLPAEVRRSVVEQVQAGKLRDGELVAIAAEYEPRTARAAPDDPRAEGDVRPPRPGEPGAWAWKPEEPEEWGL